MGFMPDSYIPVKNKYNRRNFALVAVWPHNVFMKNLRAIRRARGLSQVELAEKVGCSQAMISKIEKGQANPTLDMIEAIAAALDTSPASVFGLPELQQRALNALDRIDPDLLPSALTVLEKLADPSH